MQKSAEPPIKTREKVAELALLLEPLIQAQANVNLMTHTEQGYQKSEKADIVHTTKELATMEVIKNRMCRFLHLRSIK